MYLVITTILFNRLDLKRRHSSQRLVHMRLASACQTAYTTACAGYVTAGGAVPQTQVYADTVCRHDETQ